MVNWIRKDVHIIHQKHLETSETKNPSGSTFNPGSIWVPISKPKPDPLSPSDFGPATEIHDRIHIIFLHHLDVRLTRPMLCPFGCLWYLGESAHENKSFKVKSNIAIRNHPFIGVVPFKASVCIGLTIATFHYRRLS